MRGSARIGCIGDLLVEFVCTSKNGRHLRAGQYAGPFPSGAPGIFIDQAAQTGGDCIFLGAVGDDAFGRVELERLASHGVDTRLIRIVNGVPTGTAFVSYNDDGSRDFVFNIALSAAGLFESRADTIAALAAFNLDVMHVSGSSLGNPQMAAKVLGVCTALHRLGVKISYDPNLRKELMADPAYFDIVAEMMAMATLFLPSEEDAEALFPGQTLPEFAAALFARGMSHVVLKKGALGAEGMNAAGEHFSLPAHQVDVMDPTGAGDCFCATFVTLTTTGQYTLAETMARANAAGALAVTKVGPMEGNSSLATVEAFLAAQA